jgi:hypothetical protein
MNLVQKKEIKAKFALEAKIGQSWKMEERPRRSCTK